MKWDKFIGPDDQTPIFWQKQLFNYKGWAIKLHKFVRADNPDQFHTHTGHFIRIILWGGYVEETYNVIKNKAHRLRKYRYFFPGRIGYMSPSFCHRTERLLFAKVSYSLIFRSPRCAEVQLVGDGWAGQTVSHN